MSRRNNKYRHPIFAVVPFFFLFCIAFSAEGTDIGVKERSAPQSEDAQKKIQQLERRIADLEAIIKRLLEDKKAGAAISSQQPTVTKMAVEEKKEKTSASKDEWEEPVVQKEPAKGRDEEARRRLTELETWKRKLEAKSAKEEEEVAEKVKINLSGKYKARLNIRNNLNLSNPKQTWEYDNDTYIDQRLQLKIEADYGPLTSVILFDRGNYVFDWKEDSEGTLDRWSEFQTVNAAQFREIYFQYTGDFVLKVGRYSMFVGNGGIVLEGPNIDAIKLSYPIGQTFMGRVSTSLAYMALPGGWKNYDNFTYPAGDRSAVFGIANKLDGLLLSFNIKPTTDLTIEPYVLKVFDRGKFGNSDLNLDKDFNKNTTPRDGHFEPMWLGAAILGKMDKISYKADLIYLTGSYTLTRDINASALLLRGDYNFGQVGSLKNFSAGLEFGRGSGNKADDPATKDMKYFSGLFLCKERRKFGNIFSEDLRAGFYFWDSNLANVTFVRAISDFEPAQKLKTNLSLSKLWTTESVYKGRGPVSNWWDWSRGTSTTTAKTRDIGWELDMNLVFPIYKRVRGFTEVGFLIPGAVYQKSNGKKADPASEIVIGAEFEF
ncbi:MAG: alginate export family protein [Nitrospirota bacterium]